MIEHLFAAATGASWAVVALSCFCCAVLSAIIPWIAAEAVLLVFMKAAHSPAEAASVLVLLIAGQMLGKAGLFWSVRRGIRQPGRATDLAERWRNKLAATPRHASEVVLVSSIVGFPPFFLVTLAAGALGVDFRRFMVAGTAGRLIRFGAIVVLTHGIPFIGC